jgi:prepilin-type N-terminal cleavage/methylation domain-containing protein
MNRLRLRAEGGFTLIELLVVIAIIGILAAIAIPQFAAYRRRGYDSDAKSAVKNMATSEEAYFTDHNTYTSVIADLTKAGFKQGDNLTVAATGAVTTFTAQATVRTGCTAATGVHTFSSSSGLITSTKCD